MNRLKPVAATLLFAGLLAGLGGAARAAAVVQTQAFDDTFTAFTGAASETYPFYPSPLEATFSPFDARLGTLVDATITWQAGFGFSGVSVPGKDGSLSGEFAGPFHVNATPYSGDGASGGAGTFAGGAFSVGFSAGPDSTTFLPSEAGITCDPHILMAVEGTSPFTVDYDIAGSTYRASNVGTGSADFNGSVTLTYDYAASPTPEPTSWALLLAGFAGVGATVRGRRRADVVT